MAHELGRYKGRKSLRTVAAELGLPESSIGLMSKILNGKPVSRASEKEIGRALGVINPPRNPIRLTVPDDLADAVQAARQQGRSTRDILTKGLGNG